MIAELGPYPAYKPSGVEWLGDVPEHWEVRRLKSLCDMRSGDAITAMSIDDTGKYPVYGGNGLRGYASKYTHNGEFALIGRQGALCGNIHFARGRFWASEHAVVATVRGDHVLKWFVALLGAMKLNQYSIAAAQPGLAIDRVLNLWAPIPPQPEQDTIAHFLDNATAQIKRYIRAKEKLIALLEEQKQVLVHDAVMGRIDIRTGKPYPSYKPSGAEWLGDVPAHWQLVRNGRLFGQRNEVGYSELPILEVSLKTGIRVRDFENSSRKQIMSDRSMYKRAAKGDIAYNMMRMWQGAVGVAPVDGLVSPAYIVARPLARTEPRYFDHLFHTRSYMTEVDKYSRGIVKDRNRLYWEDFKQMPTPRPPADEQVLIADAIDRTAELTNAGIRNLRCQTKVANEFRSRLIADVVTGKLDVREAAAELPELNPTADEDGNENVPTEFNPQFSNNAL